MVRTAFNVTLRRATKSLLPLATGAVASPMALQRTITTLIGVQKQSVPVRSFLPAASRFFSDVARKIDFFRSIIDSEPPAECGIPLGSPFEVFKKSDGRASYYKEYNGEIVYVYVPPNGKENDENSGNSIEGEEDDESSATDFGVCILRQQDRRVLVFYLSVLEGEIKIDSLGFGDLNRPDDQFADNRFPFNFSRLDEDLQAAFYKYLAVRGITVDWYVENEVLYFRYVSFR